MTGSWNELKASLSNRGDLLTVLLLMSAETWSSLQNSHRPVVIVLKAGQGVMDGIQYKINNKLALGNIGIIYSSERSDVWVLRPD